MPMFRVRYSTVIEVVEEFPALNVVDAENIALDRIAGDDVGDIDGLNYGIDSIEQIY